MVKLGIFNPADKKYWIELLQTGNYIPYKTKTGANIAIDPTMKCVRLKRKKDADASKVPKWFYVELPDRKADEFIEQIKRGARYK